MKCADAKTWLSLLTATLNCLRPAIGFLFSPPPAALQQDDADRGAREIGRGPRVARIALVPQLAVERADRLATGGRAHPSRVEHGPRPSLPLDRVLRANLPGDVRVRPGGRRGRTAAARPPSSPPAPPAARRLGRGGRAAAPGRGWYWTGPTGRWPPRRRGSWRRAAAGPPRPARGRSPRRSPRSPRRSRRGKRRRGTRCRAWERSPPAGRRVAPRQRPRPRAPPGSPRRQAPEEISEEHTSELQSPCNLVCRLLLEKKKT